MKKFKKLIKHPGLFFRDYLNKRYPIINCEQKYTASEEISVLKSKSYLWGLEKKFQLKTEIEVDVVFTWVNNKEDSWRLKKEQYIKNHKDLSPVSINNARFENHNELYYSVYSVKKFMPWVRNIFIITDNQRPDWLDENDTKITIIDHKDLIEDKYLPTFNSHVIEAHLHKIKGLSEYFIYFNDDVFVAKPLEKEHFFRKNGVASLFLADKSIQNMQKKGRKTPTLSASFNSIQILQKYYHASIDTPLVHTYMPLKKSIYEKFWSTYENQLNSFLNNRFRGENDLNLASFLIPWIMYLDKEAIISQEVCYYFNIRSPHARTQYRQLLEKKQKKQEPHSFCANDFITEHNQIDNYHLELESMLQQYFLGK